MFKTRDIGLRKTLELIFISTRTQYPQKINIWAGIFNNNIIGPFEIEGNLNSATYLDLY
jgi:hypothetical protein